MMRAVMLAVATLALCATAAVAQEGTRTATATFSATVPEVLSIASANNFTFASATEADFTAGYMSSTGGPTLTHRGNVNYKITAEAAAATLAGPGGTSKSVGDVSLTGGSAGTTALSPGAAVTIHTRNAGGTTTTDVGARMALSYATDVPGTYTTMITFTIAAQ